MKLEKIINVKEMTETIKSDNKESEKPLGFAGFVEEVFYDLITLGSVAVFTYATYNLFTYFKS